MTANRQLINSNILSRKGETLRITPSPYIVISDRQLCPDRLQRVQDVLARVVAQAPWSVSSTDIRRDFHWLPIRQRIVYKQCLMTYKVVHIGQPNYLNELIQPYQPVRTLRSSTSALLVIQFVRSDFASDAFSVSAPTLWNNLHQDIRSCANQATFKSRLKSHLFSLAFTV